RMFSADDKLILAGLVGQHGTGPANQELVRLDLAARDRAVRAVVEADLGIGSLEDALIVAEATAGVILGAEPALVVPFAGGAESANQIGDRVAVLADREPG